VTKTLKVVWVYKCFLALLKKIMFITIKSFLVTKDAVIVKVARTRLASLLKFLHSHLLSQYKSLIDIVAYDNPTAKFRFAVVYNLLSLAFNSRLLICTYTTESLSIPSLYFLYPAASWLEREVWDLYGIFFFKHPDLRRILTDYGFNQHPLRKDFPLSGYKEISYSEKDKRILYSTLEGLQAYRTFSFNSVWLNKNL
jgi:NADH:ubiquinone oxidoreductase subunit C